MCIKKKPELKPILRFKEFPNDWKKIKIGDIGEVKMCKRIFNEETSTTGDIPFFKIGTFGKIPDAFISIELYNDYKKKFSFPKKGDILISAAGTIGRTVVYNGQDAYYQDSNIVWIDNNGKTVLNEFLLYIYHITKFKTEGGTVQRLYNNILKSTEIFIPTLPEQKRIASFLSAVDAKLQLLKQKKNLLEQYKKGLLQKIFSQELRFKDDNGKEFPKWERRKLGEVCKMQSGKFINANEIINIIRSDSFPCYGGNGLRGYTMRYNQNGDYPLIGRQGAHCGNITFAKGKFYATEHAIIVFEKIPFNPKWMYYLLSTLNLNQYSTGLAQPGLSIQTIERVDIFFSNIINEQTKIANFLSAVDEKIHHTEAQIQKTEEWKKGLLQNMFV